jgi:hypothetical protein
LRKTVTFYCAERGRVLTIESDAVDPPPGTFWSFLTPEQAAALEAEAAANRGRVPIRAEEYDALLGGEAGQLAALVKRLAGQ